MYPTRRQSAALLDMLGLHQRLYNAALEQRIAAWRRTRTSLGFVDQCFDLTGLRAEDKSYAALNAQSSQVTLKRLDLAFAAFFRRVKAGQTPGFPRFKAFDRFSGWGYKSTNRTATAFGSRPATVRFRGAKTGRASATVC
jgi:putative transposase